jgi:hypothetical protein
MGSQEADASGFEQDQKRRASAYVIGTQAEGKLLKLYAQHFC